MISKKDWNRIVDNYLETGKMLSEDYESLDELQVYVIQTLKRAFSRINKPVINEIHHSLSQNEK